jgi:hypothetical protein
LSQRLKARQPPPDSTWVEGDDPRLSWQEVRTFFSELETTDVVGGEDGFVKLARSPANEQALAERIQGK